MELLKDIGQLFFLYIVCSIGINCFSFMLGLPSLKIRLRKNSKFLTSKEPLYKINICFDYKDYYDVTKWILGYDENDNLSLLSVLLFPYPIKILSYGYINVEKMYSINSVKMPLNSLISLKDFYEDLAEQDRIEAEKLTQKDIDTNDIKRLNLEFEENYK